MALGSTPLRNLRHKAPFLLVVLCTLAVSIGGSTAMFTVVNSFLLSSLPYPEADRLAVIWSTRTDPVTEEVRDQLPLSPGVFTDLHDTSRAFERIAAIFPELVTVTGGAEPSRIQTMFVSGGFFQVLRTRAAIGRTLGPEDGLADAAPVVVISHGYWKRRFGGDPDVIGRTVTFGGQEHEVVGVMPAEFRFSESLVADDPRLSSPVDLWASFALGNQASQRGFHFLVAVGRLRPESSLAAARQEANAYAEHAAQAYKDTDQEYGLSVVSLSDQLFGHLRPTLWTLLAATGFVVLIACANLATLLLARGQADHSKFAIRLALGASRARVVREPGRRAQGGLRADRQTGPDPESSGHCPWTGGRGGSRKRHCKPGLRRRNARPSGVRRRPGLDPPGVVFRLLSPGPVAQQGRSERKLAVGLTPNTVPFAAGSLRNSNFEIRTFTEPRVDWPFPNSLVGAAGRFGPPAVRN